MFNHPATIEMIERLAALLKNGGAIFDRWAHRLKTEPAKHPATLEEIERLIERRINEALAAAKAPAKKD